MSEDTRVPGTEIDQEVTPNKGVKIKTADRELIEGEFVTLVKKTQGSLEMVDQLYQVVTNEKGQLMLQEVKDDLGDEQDRKALAKQIVDQIKDDLVNQITGVVEEALTRKPVGKLKKMKEESDAKKPVKTRTRKGCVYLTIGEEETIL